MNNPAFGFEKPVIVFDGYCNYCTGIINFMARHDDHDRFLFTASQTEAGKKIVTTLSVDHISSDTVILIEKDCVYSKSTAVLRVFRKMKGLIPLLYVLIIVPRFIRDAVYDVIAANRYKWFGKRDSCMVPDEKIRNKFLT